MELKQCEGRVYGARYYGVEPIWGDGYLAGWYNQRWNDMLAWCVETCGPTPIDGVWTAGAKWYVNNSKFWFREKDDLAYFILRWGK